MFREETVFEVGDQKLKYIKPAGAQSPYILNWFTEGLYNYLPDEKELKTTADKFEYVRRKVVAIMQEDPKELENVVSSAVLGSKETIIYLYPVMESCFPELAGRLQVLKDEIFFTCVFQIINDYFTYLSEALALNG